MEISKSLRWMRWICDEKKMVNNLNFSNFLLKKIKKTNIFLQKSRLFWPKIEKNPKNSKNKANIDNAMNVSFSLRWIFIARIFFTAMNSLLVSRCSVGYNSWNIMLLPISYECFIVLYGGITCLNKLDKGWRVQYFFSYANFVYFFPFAMDEFNFNSSLLI